MYETKLDQVTHDLVKYSAEQEYLDKKFQRVWDECVFVFYSAIKEVKQRLKNWSYDKEDLIDMFKEALEE